MQTTIVTVFGDHELRGLVTEALAGRFRVNEVDNGQAALACVTTGEIPVVVCDDVLDDMTGEELATGIRGVRPGTGVVIASTRENIENALNVLGSGEFVYLEKPLSPARVDHAVAVEVERARLYSENWSLRARVEGMDPMESLIGSSMAIDHVRERIRYVAAATANVLIHGAGGTGKRLAAEAIHRASARSTMPLVSVDCETSDGEALERELFGFDHADAAGGQLQERGKLALADGGTLLLGEIGEMSSALQARFVEELGRCSDVRVVATTRQDLRRLTQAGDFREDLYYAVNVLAVEMPTLRERHADILALAAHFARYFTARNGSRAVEFTADTLERLESAQWTGNVRQLRNVIERAVTFADGGVIEPEDLRLNATRANGPADLARVEKVFRTGSIREMEKLMILNRLEEKSGNRTRSAESLEISVRTLRNKLHEYDVMGRAPEPEGVLS